MLSRPVDDVTAPFLASAVCVCDRIASPCGFSRPAVGDLLVTCCCFYTGNQSCSDSYKTIRMHKSRLNKKQLTCIGTCTRKCIMKQRYKLTKY